MSTAGASPQMSSPAGKPSGISVRPKCPTVWYLDQYGNPAACSLTKLDILVEFHISTAIIQLFGIWTNLSFQPCDCLFALPMFGTVSSTEVNTGEGRVFQTVVVPTDEFRQTVENQQHSQELVSTTSPYEEYIPHLFRLPLNNIPPQSQIQLKVQYLEPLTFGGGNYHYLLPLTLFRNSISESMLMQGACLSDVVSLRLVITVDRQLQFQCSSHQLIAPQEEIIDGIKRVVINVAIPAEQSNDFDFSYSLISEEITGTLLTEEKVPGDGNFILFISPPTHVPPIVLSRSLVFMLDRSGSMTGQPYREATRALSAALGQLRPNDFFTVIGLHSSVSLTHVAFDHRQEYFRQELMPGTPENIEYAQLWLNQVQPEFGTTDIATPLMWSMNAVNSLVQTQKQVHPNLIYLPLVFVVTDGCVNNERDICTQVNQYAGDVRIMTLGIGSYCNWFFLKMISQIGRGFSDIVVFAEHIFPQVLHLLELCAMPLLTDIALGIVGLQACELYPFPIPDLYLGNPLVVSGHYLGQFPNVASVEGTSTSGQRYTIPVQTRRSRAIPVGKVFLKQRLDLLTAKAWLENSDAIKNQVIQMSCDNAMPSAYTSLVAFETTKEEKSQNDKDNNPSVNKRKYNMRRIGAAAVVGGVVIIGAALFSFGDAGASLANTPVGDMLGLGGGDCDCGACGDCGECDCGDCADCLAC